MNAQGGSVTPDTMEGSRRDFGQEGERGFRSRGGRMGEQKGFRFSIKSSMAGPRNTSVRDLMSNEHATEAVLKFARTTKV